MQFIAHRINTSAALHDIPTQYGVELDLRDFGTDLVLEHDPLKGGELFEEYLKNYRHNTMIVNVKSERVELKALELLKKYDITNFFFLDSSFPMIINLSRQGETRSAIRFSEFEGMDTVLAVQDRVQWVWVDCFTYLPLDRAMYQKLRETGLKLCLVSPELQGRPDDIPAYARQLLGEGIQFDAICTKIYNIPLWQSLLGGVADDVTIPAAKQVHP
jgi:hypothetical protein